jgi:mRNA-degrading endonuclease RelE of RelBE toxin-antitoxin system
LNVKWTIREPKNIDKVIKGLGEPQKKQYKRLVLDFKTFDDPRKLGIPKKVNNVTIYVARLSDSFRVFYSILYDEKIIQILIIGDHKEVYGKD